MSTVPMSNLDLMTPPVVKTIQQRSLLIGLVFGVIAAVGAWLQPDQFFRAYLHGLHGMAGRDSGIDGDSHASPSDQGRMGNGDPQNSGSGHALRAADGGACSSRCCLEYAASTSGPGRWMGLRTSICASTCRNSRKSYLSVNGFIIRAAIYFAIWWALSFFLTKWSAEQDHPPMRDNSARFKALSGPGLILYGFTITFAVIDWIMSIDPSWISTIFGLSFLIGQVLSALCFAVVVERILFRYKPMSELLKPEQVHDHGKFMLAFIMVWAYFAFSQWLIIWAGNLPEEITWYMRRLHGGWGYVGLFLVLFHFAVPFVFLISRPFKRDITRLVWLAVWLLLMRYVDLFWVDRTQLFRDLQHYLAGHRGPDRDGRVVAGVLLPQSEYDAAGPGL